MKATLPMTAAAVSDGHAGAMIALVPSPEDAKRLALDGGEGADELHLTFAYLGQADDWSTDQRAELIDLLRQHTAGLTQPIRATAFGAAHWNPDSEDPVWVWSVGDDPGDDEAAPTLETARAAILAALEGGQGPSIPAQHSPWQPHVTAAYSPDPALLADLKERLGAFTFDRVRVEFAGEVTDIPLEERANAASEASLSSSLAETRRALYAAVEQRAGAWRPEAAWFEPPTDEDRKRMEAGEQPLVSDDGRILGYVATWRQTDGSPTMHLGYADVGEYVPVPKGQDYTYFHQRNINYPLSDGTSAHVGIITDHGHPSQSDNPQQQAALVRVGEDDTGVWIAGAVFPDVRDNLMRFSRIKASAISGEWTSDGSFRGAAMVNHPGFPQSTAAGQDFYALAASLQAADRPTLEQFRQQLLDMVETVTSLIDGQGQGDEAGEGDERGFPEGVDADLVKAALAAVKEGGLNAAASRMHGVDLPPALTILANWLEETGEVTSQQSRAASLKAAQDICRSPEKQHPAVRARACRLISEYKAKGGK